MAAPASGFRAFLILWCGQFVSLIGSFLSSFALGVRVYQLTGSVTELAFVFVCVFVPSVLVSPFAGSLVDRWGHRRALLVSNCGAMAVALALAILLATGTFQLWNVYVATTANSVLAALQVPAFGSAVPLLVAKRHIGRANGMLLLATSASQVLAPVAAGFLLLSIRLRGVILIDCLSFGVAIISLLFIRIPRRAPDGETGQEEPATLLGGFGQCWRYLLGRRGLVSLLVFYAALCFLVAFVDVLYIPAILAFGSTAALGTVLTVGGIGMVVGSAVMSAWGGPSRRVIGVLGFSLLLGSAIIGGALRPSVPLIAVAAFIFLGSSAFIEGSYKGIWQTKVDPRMQGRALALQNMVITAPQPIAYLLAGPLADGIFQPLVGRYHVSSAALAAVIGNGPGRGFALVLLLIGILIVVTAVLGYLNPRIRRLDIDLPDAVPGDATVPNDAPVASGAPVPGGARVPDDATTATPGPAAGRA